jgi:hypothetical protein
MKGKVLPTKEAYFEAFKVFESIGYRRMGHSEILEELKGKKEMSGKIRKGKMVGFKRQYLFEAGTRRVEINTNFSDALNGPDPEGYASVVLKDHRTTEKLFSFDIRMSDVTIQKMSSYAKAFADIMKKWPSDPECGHELMLCHIKGVMHAMYFTCKTRGKDHIHRERRVEIYFTDIPDISAETKQFLDKEFDRNASYTLWEQGKGIHRIPQRVTRKRAQVLKKIDS